MRFRRKKAGERVFHKSMPSDLIRGWTPVLRSEYAPPEKAGLCKLAGRRRSIPRDHRTRPVEMIVHAGLQGVLVVAEGAERHEGHRRHELAAAEIVILVFELGREVLGEHVFDAGADRETVGVAAVEREGDRHPAER